MYPVPKSSKLSAWRDPWRGLAYVVALDAQEIATLGLIIVAEDTEYDCKIPGIHLVPLAMRRDTVEVE
jgi:hypothetical protein